MEGKPGAVGNSAARFTMVKRPGEHSAQYEQYRRRRQVSEIPENRPGGSKSCGAKTQPFLKAFRYFIVTRMKRPPGNVLHGETAACLGYRGDTGTAWLV